MKIYDYEKYKQRYILDKIIPDLAKINIHNIDQDTLSIIYEYFNKHYIENGGEEEMQIENEKDIEYCKKMMKLKVFW